MNKASAFIAMAGLVVIGLACAGESDNSTGAGGTTSTGGTRASGGASSTGGTTSTGGATSTGGVASSGGAPGSGGISSTGGATGGAGRSGATGGSPGTGGSSGPFPFNPSFILGADVSWTTQHESQGYAYADATGNKPMEQILAENGFNYVRLRTFVDPSASDGYSRGSNWCGKDDTVKMAKRVKACGMGVFVDFHMSDTWQSLGTNANAAAMPLSWQGLSQTVPATPVSSTSKLTNNLYQAAHDYVYDVMQALVAAGAKPDMVQIGNETNTGISGISMSKWAQFSALVNAGIKAVRESDPKIIVWAQNGRPRPDSAGGGNFTGWVDQYLSGKSPYTPKIDVDGVCGSTYGTTNSGADWTESFTYVVNTYKVPVMSCEYDDKSPDSPAGAIINGVMRKLPNSLGRGSFNWEPADYPDVNADGTLFTRTGKVYKTNSAMAEYPTLAKSYGLPVPSGVCKAIN